MRVVLILKLPPDLTYDQLAFDIGIDSITNVSGAMGGDLDPTKGMYWTWQSGYINFKLEGTSPDCPARKNEFQFHLGGYAYPNASVQKIALTATGQGNINVQMNLDMFLAAEINPKRNLSSDATWQRSGISL